MQNVKIIFIHDLGGEAAKPGRYPFMALIGLFMKLIFEIL